MQNENNLKLLGLSKKEIRVFYSLKACNYTPLAISRDTKISRTAVYAILQNFKKRGIVESKILNGHKSWKFSNDKDIDQNMYNSKKEILGLADGRKEIQGLSDSVVVIHRGAEAVRPILGNLLDDHKNEKFTGFQGNVAAVNWNKVFSLEDTNRFNRTLKKNGIIAEAILPQGWFETETKNLGVEWAKDFEGRTTRVNIIDQKYFKHGGQLFIFKDSVYLIALGEELVIEIRHSEIQKMFLSFIAFMQDNSRQIDANALLRNLIEKYSKEN